MGVRLPAHFREGAEAILFSRLIFDRGHGLGNRKPGEFDPGAVSEFGAESSYATWVAGGAYALLGLRGEKPLVTPELSITQVVGWVNMMANKSDLLVVLHMNSAESKSATGVECIFSEDSPAERKRQADLLGSEFAKAVGLPYRRTLSDHQTPAGKLNGLPILRDTKCAAFLLEMGFITNESDCRKVQELGPTALAHAISMLRAEGRL
jgi:N-acetylmuramoyl-L-alanine amidase